MSSSGRSLSAGGPGGRGTGDRALIDLEADIPTTAEDVEALNRLRRMRPSKPFEAVQQLVDALPAAARRPRRTTAAGWTDFEL